MEQQRETQAKLISLCKRRGFVFPGSEIYGGLANTYDFGPLGVLMLKNIIDLWWKFFVVKRPDMFGLDTSILMSPKVWEASGHTKSFTDVMVDCLNCKYRTRADHLLEDHFLSNNKEVPSNLEGLSPEAMGMLIKEEKLACPKCGEHSKWTEPKKFNLLFETNIGIVEGSQSLAYLRGEIAQGMFVNFKNVLETMRPKMPFGIAQTGKAFRNEITLGNFIFRTLEFNLAEFEYFFNPKVQDWNEMFEYWQGVILEFALLLGLPKDRLRWREHTVEERAHYSTRTADLDYEFSFGFKELFACAYRTDFDLRNHAEKSGVDLNYTDPQTGEKYIPHVMEPTFGINRMFLAVLNQGYVEEADRVVLKLDKKVAPYRAAVFPLVKNKEELVSKAKEVFDGLVSKGYSVAWDDRGNIGKRYYAQDEIGTPACITVDYQTLEDETVTVRDRDTMKQDRVNISDLNL